MGCPRKRQSLSPPCHEISSREGSNSPGPTHSVRGSNSPEPPVRGNISSPVTAPTPDVVAPPTVDEEIPKAGLDQNPPASSQILSHDLFPPLGQDQKKKTEKKLEKKTEKKTEKKPMSTWAKIVAGVPQREQTSPL
ncbi:hypothetical protein FAGAP_11226 [Fusarium agapanthi]|uniref:Uncharacterized protein n=1 Tax=Fusarium agapanthi TaxID=1803897 RepID=A0A9P5AZT0_9HYPO|nr:hypothetical protein FAGAP_11226 [Fusarium agapanthi]